MRYLSVSLALLLVGCGGSSDSSKPNPDDIVSGSIDNSEDQQGCNDISCQPDNYARSLVDPSKFVPTCESLDEFMVEDKCGYISTSLSISGDFVVGNSSSSMSLLSGNLTGDTEKRPYLESFNDRFDDENSLGYRLKIEDDLVSTNRIGMYYPDIHDGRFMYHSWETFLGTSGFDEMMFRYRLDLFGEKIDGSVPYSELLSFCDKVYTKFKEFNKYVVQPGALEGTNDPYQGRGERACEAKVLSGNRENSFTHQGLSEYRVRFFCDTIDKCVVTSLTFRSMRRAEL